MLKCFKRGTKSDVEQKLDEELERRLESAKTLEDVLKIVVVMDRRFELRNRRRISPDTMAIIAGNLLGIVLILEHERAHVITTKALAFVLRGRA